MLSTPDKVPEGCDEEEGDEDYGGVVHCCGCDRDSGGHAEEGDSEEGPCWTCC